MQSIRIWIDATEHDARLRVFGMSLLERLLHGVAGAVRAGVAISEVCVALGPGEVRPAVPDALRRLLPLRFDDRPGGSVERLGAYAASGDPVIAVHSDSIVDERIFSQLAQPADAGHEGAQAASRVLLGEGERDLDPGAVMRLEPGARPVGTAWVPAALALIASGAARRVGPGDLEGYLPMLRRDLPPYVLRVPNERARKRVERFLFWSNYKGSTDFMTRYVYPPLVWAMVRPLARWRVHPNWVTGVDILATFAAVPFFAAGAWVPGLVLAYLMSVLDSVDGKLARVTFTSSKIGEILDHGLDIVHPPIWYLAWGYALGNQSTAALPYRAALWMLGFYALDRVITGIFKQRHGKSIHGFTPFDERMRTFISRRNVNLPVFTAALAVDALGAGSGVAGLTFYAIVAWQVVCTLFHAQRLVVFWSQQERAS